jgi:hypothetical protein
LRLATGRTETNMIAASHPIFYGGIVGKWEAKLERMQ